MSLIRSRMSLDQMVVSPTVQAPQGPVCMTCGRIVDSEELVEGYPGESERCRVLVRHHGAEELRTFEMGSRNWDASDLASMMRRTNWFDPTAHEGLGQGRRVVRPGEFDGADVDLVPEPRVVEVPKR